MDSQAGPRARHCRARHAAHLRHLRHVDVDRAPVARSVRERAVSLLGTRPLRPHAGRDARLASERILRLPLPRGPAAVRSRRHQPAAGTMALRPLEFRGDRAGLGAGSRRRQSAPRVGRVSTRRRRVRGHRSHHGGGAVRSAVLPARPRVSLRVELVYHRRARLHAARLSDGQLRAGVGARRARRRVQRPVDPRRRRPVRHAARARDPLFRHSRRDAAADLQPFPLDARLLAAVLPVSAQRHAPLRVLGNPDDRADRRLSRRPRSSASM